MALGASKASWLARVLTQNPQRVAGQVIGSATETRVDAIPVNRLIPRNGHLSLMEGVAGRGAYHRDFAVNGARVLAAEPNITL